MFRLMLQEAEAIILEVQKIKTQYQDEVGSRRKPWPKSISQRIEKLFSMGFSGQSISKDTGIPYHTVLNWKPRESKALEQFHAVKVADSKLPMVTVPTLDLKNLSSLTMITPKGFRFEGEARSLILILKEVRGL